MTDGVDGADTPAIHVRQGSGSLHTAVLPEDDRLPYSHITHVNVVVLEGKGYYLSFSQCVPPTDWEGEKSEVLIRPVAKVYLTEQNLRMVASALQDVVRSELDASE